MDTPKAIMAFSQREKIKSGVIWLSHTLEISGSFPQQETQACQQIITALTNMILQEIQLAKKLAADEKWDIAEKNIEQALVMVVSGVGAESIIHLTQALSHITSIGQRSMSFLKEKGLL
jgi:ribosomal protein S7